MRVQNESTEEGGGAVEVNKMTNEKLISQMMRTCPILSFPDDYHELRAELLRRLEHGQGALGVGERLQGTITHWQPAPPEQPQGSGESLSMQKRKHIQGGGKMSDFKSIGNQPQKEVMPTDTGQYSDDNPASATGASPVSESAGLADRGEGQKQNPAAVWYADPAQGQPEKCKSPLCGEPLCPHGKCRGSYLGCEECDGPIVDGAEQPQMSARGWPNYLPLHPDAVIAAILNEWIRRFITSPSAEEIKRASRMVQDFAEAFARSQEEEKNG